MDEASPARLYCLLVGGVLVIAGIIGFFYEASFATGDSIRTENVFGVLSVNGWHNLVHIAIGALLLIAAGSAARGAALFVGHPLHRPLRARLHRHRATAGSASSPRTTPCSSWCRSTTRTTCCT